MIDQNYIKEFEEDEEEYKEFYNNEINMIKLFYLYINENNEIYNIKCEDEMIENSCLTKERILYLIKKNQFNLIKKHRLISLLKFNIDLDHTELNNFITDKLNSNYLSSLKIINSVNFNETINILHDLNCIIFIFTNNKCPNLNTTKKIHMKKIQSKTRRNK